MSAAEIIDQIKDLSPNEEAKVIEFVATMNARCLRYSEGKRFCSATDWVFQEHGS